MFRSKKVLLKGLIATVGVFGFVASTQAAAKTTPVARQTTPTTFYAVTKAATKALPKGTRVQVNYTVTKNGKKYAAVDASRLSYKLQKQAGSRSQLDVIASNLKKVATPASDKLNVLYKGAAYTTATKAANAHKIKVTTDGYVQYFANSVKKAPVSSTKITASRSKGNITYLYSKTNMAKLPDKRISKHGNYQYRLAIRNNNKQNKLSQSYSVGTLKNLFYVPTLKA